MKKTTYTAHPLDPRLYHAPSPSGQVAACHFLLENRKNSTTAVSFVFCRFLAVVLFWLWEGDATSAMRGTVDGRCALTSDSSTCQIDKFASGTFGSGINKWLLIVDVEIFAQAVRTRRDYECCVRVHGMRRLCRIGQDRSDTCRLVLFSPLF